jgi:hypothetical protein
MQPTVKDIKEFLSSLSDDVPVFLDKNGWEYDPEFHRDMQHLIRSSGVLQKRDESKFGGGMILIINN